MNTRKNTAASTCSISAIRCGTGRRSTGMETFWDAAVTIGGISAAMHSEDGLEGSLNDETIRYGREMLLGRAGTAGRRAVHDMQALTRTCARTARCSTGTKPDRALPPAARDLSRFCSHIAHLSCRHGQLRSGRGKALQRRLAPLLLLGWVRALSSQTGRIASGCLNRKISAYREGS